MRIVDNLGLPTPLVTAITSHKYDKGEADFSVTELNTPAFQRKLKIQHDEDLEIEAADRLFALQGTVMHTILQEAAANTSNQDHLIFEKRLFGEFFGKKISGQIDLLDTKAKLISDYKSCSYWTAIYGAKDEWVQQLNVYKLLAQQNGYEVDRLQIVAVFRDWSKRQAKFKTDYPEKPVHLFEIEVWPEERTLKFIEDRVKALSVPDPPICSPEERWERGGSWAVEKPERKTAVKLFNTAQEAYDWVVKNKKPNEILHVVQRRAEPVRCLDFCEVRSFCPYGKGLE